MTRPVRETKKKILYSPGRQTALYVATALRVSLASILNQILRPIQRFPQCLKSVRIIAFAFFL
jgi:hypothetical protein